jgi:hypothetical protein
MPLRQLLESDLLRVARERIDAGQLPSTVPDRVWGSPKGNGQLLRVVRQSRGASPSAPRTRRAVRGSVPCCLPRRMGTRMPRQTTSRCHAMDLSRTASRLVHQRRLEAERSERSRRAGRPRATHSCCTVRQLKD